MVEACSESILSLLAGLFARINQPQSNQGPNESAALYIDLLSSDLEIRRVTGRMDEPDGTFCEERSAGALKILRQLDFASTC